MSKKVPNKSFLPIVILILAVLATIVTLTAACSNINKSRSHAETQSDIVSEVEVSSQPPTTTTTTTTTTTPTTTTTTTPTTTTTTTATTTTTTVTTPKTTATENQTSPTTPTVSVPQTDPRIDKSEIGTLVVTASAVNIRGDAGSDAELFGSVNNGAYLECIGFITNSDGEKWYAVKFQNKTCFVIASCVKFSTDSVGTAYLTFDDGPSENTPKILEILAKYNVKATFFVKYNKGCEKYYKQIVNQGHTIANHTYSHDYSKLYTNEEGFYTDLSKMENYIHSTTGITTKIVRFPGGSSNTVSKKYGKGIMTALSKSLTEKGYVFFDWNVDSGDASGKTVAKAKIVDNVKNSVETKKQVIILMHDTKFKTTTVEALPEIIEYLQNRNYTILPISDSTPTVHHRISN